MQLRDGDAKLCRDCRHSRRPEHGDKRRPARLKARVGHRSRASVEAPILSQFKVKPSAS
jgi:hypothetical protein